MYAEKGMVVTVCEAAWSAVGWEGTSYSIILPANQPAD